MGPEIIVGLAGAIVFIWLVARARRSAPQSQARSDAPAPRPDQTVAQRLARQIEREPREAIKAQKRET
jgi:hypothetical protein